MKNLSKTIISIILACFMLLTACNPKGADKNISSPDSPVPSGKTLNLYTCAGLFPQDIFDGFEADTGIKINQTSFKTNEDMLADLSEPGNNYDLIIADDYIIETCIKKKLVSKLDIKSIENYKNINKIFKKQFYDKSDKYTVPLGAGVQTIVYNPDLTGFNIKGYADLWNESLRNRIGVTANYRVINGMALKVLGKSYNTRKEADINAAGEKLKELAPNIYIIQDNNLHDYLLSGKLAAAVMYTSQATISLMIDDRLKAVYPEEGIGFGVMAGFIPKQSQNPDASHAFLNYLLEASHAARYFEYTGYYSTNSAADDVIQKIYKPFLTLPQSFDTKSEMIKNISDDADKQHLFIWESFKEAVRQSGGNG